MFANDEQLAAVCQALVEPLAKGTLWRGGKMTDLGAKWLKRMPGFSHGEVVVIRFAFSLWNDSNKGPSFQEVLQVLDGSHLARIARLMLAMADGRAGAIEAWLDRELAAAGGEVTPPKAPRPTRAGLPLILSERAAAAGHMRPQRIGTVFEPELLGEPVRKCPSHPGGTGGVCEPMAAEPWRCVYGNHPPDPAKACCGEFGTDSGEHGDDCPHAEGA